jgi:hypothetical protein
MGNLARAGFGATNDGTWPYSYDSWCERCPDFVPWSLIALLQ